ncbi:hypothetical protein [Mariniluteicoccus flavus]
MTRELAVLATIALTLSTGCTVAVPTPTPSTTNPPAAPVPSAPATPAASATPHEPLPTVAPVATREAAQSGARVKAEVFPIKRERKGTVVSVRMTVLSGQKSYFLQTLSTFIITEDSPQSMRIVDADAGTIHLPSTVNQSAVCGPSLNRDVDAGDIIWASCVFGPLPESTTTVALQFGPFGSFDAIPVR